MPHLRESGLTTTLDRLARVQERKSNKIKDFIAMSGPLGVTHMLVLAQSASNKNATEDEKDDLTSNVNLRITRLPRGPTLGFKVLRYALVRDILAATKRPRSPGKEYSTEPIVSLTQELLSFALCMHTCMQARGHSSDAQLDFTHHSSS